MGPEQVLLLQVRVNLGVMAIKRYSTLPRTVPHQRCSLVSYPGYPFGVCVWVLFIGREYSQNILSPANKVL